MILLVKSNNTDAKTEHTNDENNMCDIYSDAYNTTVLIRIGNSN